MSHNPKPQAQPKMTTETQEKTYSVFTRTWWKENPSWPNGLEPQPGTRHYRGHPQSVTEEEAREYCQEWNDTHDPGRLSLKAEYESD